MVLSDETFLIIKTATHRDLSMTSLSRAVDGFVVTRWWLLCSEQTLFRANAIVWSLLHLSCAPGLDVMKIPSQTISISGFSPSNEKEMQSSVRKKSQLKFLIEKFLFLMLKGGSMDDWVTCLEVDWILLSLSRLSLWTSWNSFNLFKQTRWPSCLEKLTQPPTCPKALAGFEPNGSEIIFKNDKYAWRTFARTIKIFLFTQFYFSYIVVVASKKDCSCSWKSMKF